MRTYFLAIALGALGACTTPAEPAAQATLTRGAALAQSQCSSCHAVGVSGESPAPEAPAFRRLSHNYRVADLEEALAEGISVGHPAMPQFAFAPEDAEALVRYLDSIQEDSAPS